MTSPPINAAAMQALAAYGVQPRQNASAPSQPAAPMPAPQAGTARRVVRAAPGLSVELSAAARAALIVVQSAASGGGLGAAVGAEAAPRATWQADSPPPRPGGRLNVTI